MKSKFIILLLFLTSLLLTKCYTPYQARAYTGGYSETQLDTNVFRVHFSGNGYTSSERATDLCLLRCAELCKMYGFDYFVIVDSETKIRTVTTTSPTKSTSNSRVYTYGNTTYIQGNTNTYGGNTQTFHKPGINNTIVCIKGQPLEDGVVKYKPDFLIKSIKSKYNIQ